MMTTFSRITFKVGLISPAAPYIGRSSKNTSPYKPRQAAHNVRVNYSLSTLCLRFEAVRSRNSGKGAVRSGIDLFVNCLCCCCCTGILTFLCTALGSLCQFSEDFDKLILFAVKLGNYDATYLKN